MNTKNGNGTPTPDLPEDRKAAVQYGLEQFQVIASERDVLQRENFALKSDIAGLKVALEAQTTQMSEMESRVATAMLTKDQALAERIKYEGLFVAIFAQLRAFQVPAAPLIKDADEAQ